MHLPLSILSLSLKHEYLRTVLLSFSDCSNCSGFLLIKHASKLASFSLSALFLLLVELLELLILAIFVDDRVLEPVDLVGQATNLAVCAVQLITEMVQAVLPGFMLVLHRSHFVPELGPFSLETLLHFLKVKLRPLELHVVFFF